MNENLKKLFILYAEGKKEELSQFLESLTKKTLIATLLDLITIYLNDKNSSKIREMITAWIAGYETSHEKLGYNGFKLEIDTGNKVFGEIKPQNTENIKRKLKGGGNFSDYTPERFKNDLKNNPNIIVSGFVNGFLIYILEIPFECLSECLKQQLKKKFGLKLQRKSGEYLRSAIFSFKDYKKCKNIKLIYLNQQNLQKFQDYLSKDFLCFLNDLAQKET